MAECDQASSGTARLDNLPVGEFDLLARLRERLPPARPPVLVGVGDDAAVSVPRGATATSVDAIVEGVHFRRRDASLRLIGRKGLAAALSDLAAMGAGAGEAYVVLGVPEDLDEDQCLELLEGIEELARETGTALAGGDVTRSPVLSLTFTVVGHADGLLNLETFGNREAVIAGAAGIPDQPLPRPDFAVIADDPRRRPAHGLEVERLPVLAGLP